MANKIIYEDYAVGAKDYAYVDTANSDNQTIEGEDPYTVSSIFQNSTTSEYSSFEYNGIDLVENIRLFGSTDTAGFISDRISGADKRFTTNPKLVIKFTNSKVVSGNGITLFFANHYCSRVKVKYKVGSSYITPDEYIISSKEAYLPCRAQGYSEIEIEFVETEVPYQYVMVRRLDFGHTVEITKFRSISYNKKMDFYCADVPINTLDVQFIYDDSLNIYRGQKFSLYRNNVLIGTYWVADSENLTDKLYNITAEDVFSRLDNTVSKSMVYNENSNNTVDSLIDVIESTANVTYDSGWDSVVVRGGLGQTTKRKLLAYLMFAINSFAKANNDGSITIFQTEYSQGEQVITRSFVDNENKIIGDATFRPDATKSISASFAKWKRPVNYADGTSLSSLYKNERTLYFAERSWDQGDKVTVTADFPVASAYVAKNNSQNTPVPWAGFAIATQSIMPEVVSVEAAGEEASGKYSIIGVPYDKETIECSNSVDISLGEEETSKEFSNMAYYLPSQYETVFNNLCERVFSFTGSVDAKVVLNYTDNNTEKILDVGDYIEIPTKYSGVKKGTITQITADVGETDIVGNVVVTVWQ